MRRVGRSGSGRQVLDVSQDRDQHGQCVRAHVPQTALLTPPRGVRVLAVRTGGVERAQPLGASREPAVHRRLFGDPGGGLGREAQRAEDDRGHRRLLRRLGHRTGPGDRRGDRLVHQQVAARLRRTDRERGLDVRRQREGHRVARLQERVDALLARVRPGPVRGGEGVRRLGPAAPHSAQLDAGVGGERGGLGVAGPGAGAEEADAQRRRGVRSRHACQCAGLGGRADRGPGARCPRRAWSRAAPGPERRRAPPDAGARKTPGPEPAPDPDGRRDPNPVARSRPAPLRFPSRSRDSGATSETCL